MEQESQQNPEPSGRHTELLIRGTSTGCGTELQVGLHSPSPGLSLNPGEGAKQMVGHHSRQSPCGCQPHIPPATSFLFVSCFCCLKLPSPTAPASHPSGSHSKGIFSGKPSWLLTLTTAGLILFFFTHLSPQLAFNLLEKWALASP